jgi:NAD(P)-dependent dehydrogenase (short-subunit alcohol dehydrogenase family)
VGDDDGARGWDPAGKNVLVTGASSGIGAALAVGFARDGANVGICARRTDRLEEVLSRITPHAPRARAFTVDLADLDGIDEFARRADEALGGVDVLVNNAGIPKRRTVFDLTAAVVTDVMRINYLSPVALTLALLPRLVERSGRVVMVSSVAARLSPPGEAAYAASKAALSAWAESMQVDVRDTGVRLHVVNPGVIDTDLFHLPDNDPTIAEIEALPVEAMVDPVLEMLRNDTFEIYVPEWFADVAASKYRDVGAFLEGSIAWARSRSADR